MATLFFLLMACGTATFDIVEDCDVLTSAISPDAGEPGTQVAAVVSPVTTHWDTAVYLDGVRAEVSEITRTNCETCDACREEQGCVACNDCDACDALCKERCVESVVFTVPDMPAGDASVVIYNNHGTSNPVSFTVEGTSDSGTPDTGTSAEDSGSAVDSGVSEATD